MRNLKEKFQNKWLGILSIVVGILFIIIDLLLKIFSITALSIGILSTIGGLILLLSLVFVLSSNIDSYKMYFVDKSPVVKHFFLVLIIVGWITIGLERLRASGMFSLGLPLSNDELFVIGAGMVIVFNFFWIGALSYQEKKTLNKISWLWALLSILSVSIIISGLTTFLANATHIINVFNYQIFWTDLIKFGLLLTFQFLLFYFAGTGEKNLVSFYKNLPSMVLLDLIGIVLFIVGIIAYLASSNNTFSGVSWEYYAITGFIIAIISHALIMASLPNDKVSEKSTIFLSLGVVFLFIGVASMLAYVSALYQPSALPYESNFFLYLGGFFSIHAAFTLGFFLYKENSPMSSLEWKLFEDFASISNNDLKALPIPQQIILLNAFLESYNAILDASKQSNLSNVFLSDLNDLVQQLKDKVTTYKESYLQPISTVVKPKESPPAVLEDIFSIPEQPSVATATQPTTTTPTTPSPGGQMTPQMPSAPPSAPKPPTPTAPPSVPKPPTPTAPPPAAPPSTPSFDSTNPLGAVQEARSTTISELRGEMLKELRRLKEILKEE